MNEELLNQHQREWETFDVMQAMALDDLITGEIEIRKRFGMIDAHLPFQERNKIARDRQAWIDEWGGRGRQAKTLTARQQEQTEDQETEAMLEDMYRQTQADDGLKEEIAHALDEKEAVTSFYEVRDEPVPAATQQRFAKRLLELRDRYDGKEPQQRRTLDDDDLEQEAESMQDLTRQHEIIRMHYQRAEYIPQTSIEQMAKDKQGFQEETETYRLFQKSLLEGRPRYEDAVDNGTAQKSVPGSTESGDETDGLIPNRDAGSAIEDHRPIPEETYETKVSQMVRNVQWQELKTEQDLIALEYHYNIKEAIPPATQRRMDKAFAEFKAKWDNEKPEVRPDGWKTLDEDDLKNEFQSWRNLMVSHNVVEYFYARQNMQVPLSTRDRQLREVDNYQREVDTYKASLSQQPAGEKAQATAEDFKAQLKALRERNHQSGPRPKPG